MQRDVLRYRIAFVFVPIFAKLKSMKCLCLFKPTMMSEPCGACQATKDYTIRLVRCHIHMYKVTFS